MCIYVLLRLFYSGVGSTFGKRATWIGANGNQTFIKIDESLITSQMLPNMRVTANKDTISTSTFLRMNLLDEFHKKCIFLFHS